MNRTKDLVDIHLQRGGDLFSCLWMRKKRLLCLNSRNGFCGNLAKLGKILLRKTQLFTIIAYFVDDFDYCHVGSLENEIYFVVKHLHIRTAKNEQQVLSLAQATNQTFIYPKKVS